MRVTTNDTSVSC